MPISLNKQERKAAHTALTGQGNADDCNKMLQAGRKLCQALDLLDMVDDEDGLTEDRLDAIEDMIDELEARVGKPITAKEGKRKP